MESKSISKNIVGILLCEILPGSYIWYILYISELIDIMTWTRKIYKNNLKSGFGRAFLFFYFEISWDGLLLLNCIAFLFAWNGRENIKGILLIIINKDKFYFLLYICKNSVFLCFFCSGQNSDGITIFSSTYLLHRAITLIYMLYIHIYII